MPRPRATAAIALSALFALGACEAGGDHQRADEAIADSAQQPVRGPEAAAEGTLIPDAPPPAGVTGPTPPDGNPSPTTPHDPMQPSTGAATKGGVEGGNAPIGGEKQP